MLNAFSRTELAIGREGLKKLKGSSVAVLGMGGVGSYTAEALARAGIGKLILVDKDVVDVTNINRQIHALHSTIGRSKVELMAKRIGEINPECHVVPLQMFYNEGTYEEVFREPLDYLVDAMDTVSYKIHVVVECKKRGIPIVSSMGAANKLNPAAFRVADLFKTSYDPIAKVMRKRLKGLGITQDVKVVYSTEKPLVQREEILGEIVQDPNSPISKVRRPPASISFVPPVAGLILAGVVVNDLLGRPLEG
ncbi:tRNA threonylcarbamoyladenosine dehydratase [Thermicanus aegyptius]|uniref:tRNA threonylcarbamoyladenosine dehydratase n=1 Tax=Thermicanus aegyptius TaxID=94009 RepID=UPI000414FBCE|nr:tRNA threonylcarbamoyladenosine dehydratase [Thermicanus aegyptius]